MEQLDYNLLFRWFVGLGVDEVVWHPTTFTKNRDRLVSADVAQRLLQKLTELSEIRRLLSDEHFSVDGTLIDAWASMKSFVPRDGSDDDGDDDGGNGRGGRNPSVNFRGRRRTNDTHVSTPDPQARLYRKAEAQPAQLCYIGHALMENRNGLIVDARVTRAHGRAEREAALEMLRDRPTRSRRTLGADARYHTRGFVRALRESHVTPHVAGKKQHNAIDARTTRHDGYALSQRARKRIEEFFGWGKTVADLTKTRFIGPDKVGWH